MVVEILFLAHMKETQGLSTQKLAADNTTHLIPPSFPTGNVEALEILSNAAYSMVT
jgi:hypothetical protein